MRQVPTYNTYASEIGKHYIKWQIGPIGEDFNGWTLDGVIRAAINRLEHLNSILPHPENSETIRCLNEALSHLDNRTRDRFKRGIMGKDEK